MSPRSRLLELRLFFWGILLGQLGIAVTLVGISTSALFVFVGLGFSVTPTWIAWSGEVITILAVLLILAEIIFILPTRRRYTRLTEGDDYRVSGITVVLTAYNDEESIAPAVQDFLAYPLVKRVIVVSNNSTDRTYHRAQQAGALALNESKPGYGQCVYRCLSEGLSYDDTECVVLCEGDMTFRARDLTKLLAFIPHAQIVNGTRIVEQLRAYSTQLTTFMYCGNFYVGKLLEAKHFGKGTYTDVGATYKVIRTDVLRKLLPKLNPEINLEFNAHFLDTALENDILLLECPITFHARIGKSKGGNVNNLRALQVGLRMIFGLIFGWKKVPAA